MRSGFPRRVVRFDPEYVSASSYQKIPLYLETIGADCADGFFVTISAAKSLVLRGQLPRFALRFFLPGTFSLCAELLRFQNLRKHFIVNEGNRGRGRTAHLPGSSGKGGTHNTKNVPMEKAVSAQEKPRPLGGTIHRRIRSKDRQAHQQECAGQDTGRGQGKAEGRHGGMPGAGRQQSGEQIHRGYLAADLV